MSAGQTMSRASRGMQRVLTMLALCAGVVASDATALTGDGRQVTGAFAMTNAGVAVGGERIALDALVGLTVPGDRATALDQGVVLRDGTILRGVVSSVQAGQVQVDSDQAGALTIPFAQMRAVVLAPRSLAALDTLPVDQGGAWLANGDRVSGTCAFLNDQAVGIDTGRKVMQVPRSRVDLLLFAGAAPVAPGLRLLLADGSRLAGRPTGGASLSIQTLAGLVPVPLLLVRAAWTESGAVQPLGLLTLPAPTQQALLDEPGMLLRNRGSDGGVLHAAGRSWDRGLCLRAGSSVVVPAAGAARLVAEVAVTDGSPGSVDFRVLRGSTVLWSSGPRRAGDVPMSCGVATDGAESLTLECARPAGTTAAATGIWGWAALIR